MKNEATTLAALMDRSHQAVLQRVEQLADQDLHRRFTADGKQMNSAF